MPTILKLYIIKVMNIVSNTNLLLYMFLFPKKRNNSIPFRKSKELDVNSLKKQLGRLTYIGLGLEI
jgi:hypothetical protein